MAVLTFDGSSVVLTRIDKLEKYPEYVLEEMTEIRRRIMSHAHVYGTTKRAESIANREIDSYINNHKNYLYWIIAINGKDITIHCKSEKIRDELFDKINSVWYDNYGHIYVQKVYTDDGDEDWKVDVKFPNS